MLNAELYQMKYFIILILSINFITCNSKSKISLVKYNLDYPNNLKIITRDDWGSTPNTSEMGEHHITKITLHHGGVEFMDDKDPIEYLKNLQSWSRSEKKWIDIPYHYLIDLNGIIYEGRHLKYPGNTNTNYDPAGHLLICILGNYEVQKLKNIQLNTLIDLIAYFCHELNINPNAIKGHKDYTDTACPGKDLYKYIEDGTITATVEKKLSELNKLP